MDIDILAIDRKIQENFSSEKDKIETYRNELDKIEKILNNVNILSLSTKNSLSEIRNQLKNKILDIQTNKNLNFYIMDTVSIISDYKKLLDQPKKISFFGKTDQSSKVKNKLIKDYLEKIKKYNIDINDYQDKEQKKKKEEEIFVCSFCNNKNNYQVIDLRIYICEDCGNQIEHIGNSSSYTDVSRVNISSKYTYERRVHFRDCINQYQGKQNSTINEKVYKDLEEQFRLHGLLNDDPNHKFDNINKEHILLFLKELGYTKHYEDVFLIYYKLTDKKPNDISYLEQKLMDDFDTLSVLYDQKFKQTKRLDRKNFINTQYVLYQLLRKYKYPCKKEDFNILKTLDRKSFHDEICMELFTELGWNFVPFF